MIGESSEYDNETNELHQFIEIFRKFAAATRVFFGRSSVESGMSKH